MIGADFPTVLDAARRGDHAALETLYRDTAPVVLGYLRGLGAVDSEDLASEVFVAMVKGIAGFEGDEHHFRSWLLSIAHRRRADATRRWSRRPEDLHEPASMPEVADGWSTSTRATARVEVAAVLAAMDQLTEDQRAVLLRTVADLSLEQVAAVLDKPVTAVKALQRRAQAALLRQVGPPEPPAERR